MSRLYKTKLNLDLSNVKLSCERLNAIILTNFSNDEHRYKIDDNTPLSTMVANSYNLFLYPFYGFPELYSEIRNIFNSTCIVKTPHYIQGWLNYNKLGQNLGWHRHWSGVTNNSIHGVFCVDVKDSKTTYQYIDNQQIEEVYCEDNLLVMANSNNNLHKTSDWNYETPRITIAFDIHPIENLQNRLWINHWTPL